MLDNSIRGGQIFLHKLTMFKQIFFRSIYASFIISCLITGYFTLQKLPDYDFYAAFSYSKAHLASWFDDNKPILHKNARYKTSKIDVYNKMGLYTKDASAKNVIKHSGFKLAYTKVLRLCFETLILAIIIGFGLVLSIFIIWSRFGERAKETKQLSGSKILTAKEASILLRKQKLASDFVFGDVPLVKNTETRHILVTGQTGSGKTNLFHNILPQIRRKNSPALVIDQTGEMISRYYDSDRGDIIFNPFDSRSHDWDFKNEVSALPRLNSLASSIFCTHKSSDSMWNNASKQLFIDSVNWFIRDPDHSIAKLYELITTLPLKEASRILQGTASSSLLDPAGDKTAMSIRSNTIAFIDWLQYLPEPNLTNKFCIKDWIDATMKSHKGRWLFISSSAEERSLMQPLQSMLLDLSVLTLQSLAPDPDRRFWIIADELASLKKLHALPQGLAELRKYGGCIMVGLQSLSQIYDIYGHHQTNNMFGQFGTKVMFRSDEPAMAKMISEIFGQVEYREQQQNTSYGAHEHRDGISYTEQERSKLLITTDMLASLENLECFISLPEPKIRLAKIKIPYAKFQSSSRNCRFMPS